MPAQRASLYFLHADNADRTTGFIGACLYAPIKREMKSLLILILFFFSLINSGCSTIEKCGYFEPLDKNNNWTIEKNAAYKPYYSNTTHYYYCGDSLSSMRIGFTNTVGSLTIGLPLIPIFPIPVIKNKTFQVSIEIKTQNDTDISTISKYIHISFNDSLVMKPNKTYLSNELKEENNNFLQILYHYNIKPNKIKKITIRFDEKLNDRLKFNYKALILKRQNRLRYSGFFFPAS